MGTHWGYEGTIKFGANAVANVISFSLTESVSPVDDTAMGDAWKTHIAGSGIKEWTARCDVHWSETDTNGQLAATLGASLTLNLYPEGSTTGDYFATGTATVISRGTEITMDGSTIRRGMEFQGSGALTWGTV